MTLIVEDGTKKADADTYALRATLSAYATAQGRTLTGTDAAQDAALRRATVFIDTGFRFAGQKFKRDQALSWPRADAYTDEDFPIRSDVVPAAVVNACCELALAALAGDFDADTDGARITREKIGELETEYAGAKGTVKRFPVAERLLGQVGGKRRTGTVRLVRS